MMNPKTPPSRPQSSENSNKSIYGLSTHKILQLTTKFELKHYGYRSTLTIRISICWQIIIHVFKVNLRSTILHQMLQNSSQVLNYADINSYLKIFPVHSSCEVIKLYYKVEKLSLDGRVSENKNRMIPTNPPDNRIDVQSQISPHLHNLCNHNGHTL